MPRMANLIHAKPQKMRNVGWNHIVCTQHPDPEILPLRSIISMPTGRDELKYQL
jgi:hypothetical protein